MTVTRTRISGNFIRPSGSSCTRTHSSCSSGTTRTRVSGDYIRPTCSPFFGRTVTRTPVCSSYNSWFSNPFRSFWHTPVYSTPVYPTPVYTTPVHSRPTHIVHDSSHPVVDALVTTAVLAGLIALVVLVPYCHTERVCKSIGNGLDSCHYDQVCGSLLDRIRDPFA